MFNSSAASFTLESAVRELKDLLQQILYELEQLREDIQLEEGI